MNKLDRRGMDGLRHIIDQINIRREEALAVVAISEREKIIDLLEKNNISFTSGNGSYLLWDENRDRQIDPGKIRRKSEQWAVAIEIMETPTDNTGGILAMYMPDYRPGDRAAWLKSLSALNEVSE